MDVVTIGDLEAQYHNPNWFVNHKHMLRPNQEGEVNKLGYFILKVPECMRQPPQQFSPRGWQFGLHNRENLDSNGSEAIKLGIAVQYGLVGEEWDHFCDAIVDDPKAMLACYGLQDGVASWTDEQIKHVLALDALFLAYYIALQFPTNGRLCTFNMLRSQFNERTVFFSRFNMWNAILLEDLYRVENQIPFVLIDKVVEYITNSVAFPTFQGNDPLIDDLQYQQRSIEYAIAKVSSPFMATMGETFKIDNSSQVDEITHILGAAYKVICGSKGLLMKSSEQSKEHISIPSATKLEQSAIKIFGVDGPLDAMSYKGKCLRLPKMVIYDSTCSFIRNMAWYELKTIPNGCLFSDYIFLMMDLIQAPEDLDLLIECKVIDNGCGIKGLEMWTDLKEGMTRIASSQIHHEMKVDIMNRYHHQRYRLWSEFKIIFCSRPWLVLSTLAVVLVTMATLVQTYISIIGSNQMKPKFP